MHNRGTLMRQAFLIAVGAAIAVAHTNPGTAHAFHGCLKARYAYTSFQSYGYLGGCYPTNMRYGMSAGEGFMLPGGSCGYGGGCYGGGCYGGDCFGGGSCYGGGSCGGRGGFGMRA